MKRIVILGMLLSAAAATLSAAQLYRWVDENGRTQYSDTPPPPSAKSVEQRKIRGSTPPSTSLPYSLQLAVKNFPVTLWANNCGEACDKARTHLSRRGVPYTEVDPQADLDAFKKASGGDMGIPLLFIGSNKLRGYLDSEWDSALDIAGYPKTALVPVKSVAKPAAAASAKPQTETPKPAADGNPAPAQ